MAEEIQHPDRGPEHGTGLRLRRPAQTDGAAERFSRMPNEPILDRRIFESLDDIRHAAHADRRPRLWDRRCPEDTAIPSARRRLSVGSDVLPAFLPRTTRIRLRLPWSGGSGRGRGALAQRPRPDPSRGRSADAPRPAS
jgi:hypothetical protein